MKKPKTVLKKLDRYLDLNILTIGLLTIAWLLMVK